jgi:hypothetical protein
MMGKLVPVIGAETRNLRSTRRLGAGKTIGLMEKAGVGEMTGRAFACPIKAWSVVSIEEDIVLRGNIGFSWK